MILYRPLMISNVAVAAVFRCIDKYRPTLLVDEADTFLGKQDEFRGVLNGGHHRQGRVLRVVGEDHEPRAFATFSAVAIAMIGKLPDTLSDRSIEIRMRRKRACEVVERVQRSVESPGAIPPSMCALGKGSQGESAVCGSRGAGRAP